MVVEHLPSLCKALPLVQSSVPKIQLKNNDLEEEKVIVQIKKSFKYKKEPSDGTFL